MDRKPVDHRLDPILDTPIALRLTDAGETAPWSVDQVDHDDSDADVAQLLTTLCQCGMEYGEHAAAPPHVAVVDLGGQQGGLCPGFRARLDDDQTPSYRRAMLRVLKGGAQ